MERSRPPSVRHRLDSAPAMRSPCPPPSPTHLASAIAARAAPRPPVGAAAGALRSRGACLVARGGPRLAWIEAALPRGGGSLLRARARPRPSVPSPRDENRAPDASSSAGAPRTDFDTLVYSQLRDLARRNLRGERGARTLQPTALVHEVFLRLSRGTPRWESRAHFFGAAARAMRQILVDRARARRADRRGGDRARVTLSGLDGGSEDRFDDLLAVHDALARLEAEDPRKARVVELRFFAGLETSEVAEALGVSERTVFLDWRFAKAWLVREIQGRTPS